MRLRLYLFGFLTVLSLLWTLYFFLSIRATREAQIAAGGVGTEIGVSLATQLFILPGVLGIIMFGILTNRAYKAIKQKRLLGDAPSVTPLDPNT